VRPAVILRVLLPLALSFVRDRRRWLLAGGPVPRTPGFHQARAARLLAALQRLGPSFVKLGQVFAGRADLLGEPYAEVLKGLTDRVPPAPWPAVAGVIEAELGRPPGAVFEALDADPIAAGSLGQVHRARWQGRPVAVKVLRPGVERQVAMDLRAARAIAGRLARWFPNPHTRGVVAVIDEFAVRVQDELDFRQEARNLALVRANFAGHPRIRIPRAFAEVSSRRVLVMEFLEGTRIDGLAPGRPGSPDPADVVERLVELYVRMMFVHGLFHADPHPGNLLVAPDGALVLLDFGVVIPVPVERRRQLVDAVFAAIRNDAAGVVKGFYDLGLVEPGADRAAIERLADLLLDLAARRTTTAERIDLLTREVLDELHHWPVRMPSDLVYFARTAGLIEGIGVRYDPRFNPVMAAGPVLFRMRHELAPALGGLAAPPVDWPSAIGHLLGRAARALTDAGETLASLLAGALDTAARPRPAIPSRNATFPPARESE
jgi:predicted unusual protein kinase regulating ubiquinone biosynthesis (AarF/ABC1/UbiB family)